MAFSPSCDLEIKVVPQGWGRAPTSNIEVLLTDVASHVHRLLRCPVTDCIVVVAASGDDAVPVTHYRDGSNGPIPVQLTARDTKWAQFAYQFSHEFCHIVSNYERLRANPNQWFHEALCELASVFTLRRMAERWPTRPPYPNWADYAPSLASYADDLLDNENRRLPADLTLGHCLAAHEDQLRSDPYLRDLNAVVAYQLLPTFEAEPTGWNAVRHLPKSSGYLMEYLADWHDSVASTDKPFVKRLIGAFQ